MQLTQETVPLLRILQGFGANRHLRGWNRVLDRLYPHSQQVSQHIITKRWGTKYLANPANYIDWNVLCHGDYEQPDLDFFALMGRQALVCLDVGANVGHHAIYFASLGWTVHAFEPNPNLKEEFLAKVGVSGLDRVVLHPVGLGLQDGEVGFELENEANSGTGRFVQSQQSKLQTTPLGFLPIRNGDRYLRESGIVQVDVIKMDIQGFEPEALSGLHETLWSARPFVCIEISQDNRTKFNSFENFRRYFPPNYTFARNREKTLGLIRYVTTERYAGNGFHELDGNIFCVPDERAVQLSPSRQSLINDPVQPTSPT